MMMMMMMMLMMMMMMPMQEYESDESEDNLDEESSQESECEDIKVVKLNISDDEEDEDVYDKLDDIDEAEDIELRENDLEEQIPDISDDYIEQVLDLKYEIDFKKLQLPKLRSIVVEKGLANNTDVSKLKKNELLKLLGVE